MLRWILSAFVTSGILFLNGCGSSAPPPRSFQAEISQVQSAVASGDGLVRSGNFQNALERYQSAMDLVRKTKVEAEDAELSRLKNLEEEIRGKILSTELRKRTANTPVVAAVTPPAPSEDIAAKQQREEAEAKKKAAAVAAQERKKAEDMLKVAGAAKSATAKEQSAHADDEESDGKAVPKKKADAADAPGAAGATNAAVAAIAAGKEAPANASGVIEKAQGAFPEVTDKNPELEITKLEVRGNFVLAYVQLFNKSVDGARIETIPMVFFKDNNSNSLINPMSVGNFVFNKYFKADLKDPLEQVYVPVVTAGSQAVEANCVLRFVAVGQSPNAAKCQSVSVKVQLGGRTLQASGTTKPAAVDPRQAPANIGGVNFK